MTTHVGQAQDAPAEVVSAGLPKADPKRLHFSLLQEAEQTSFVAGLRSRIRARLTEALRAPTASIYLAKRAEHLDMYAHLTVVLREELVRAAEPVSDDQILLMLEQVEARLGETRRYQLEQAINTSHAASRMAARIDERVSGPVPVDQREAVALQAAMWAGHWTLLAWTVDCVMAAVDGEHRVSAESEVLDKVFETLDEAATGLYVAISALYDLRVGAPEDDE
jgi:hypothetical protein